MAEIRKHTPRSTAIGDQVRAAIGGVPRPNQPGGKPVAPDPFYEETRGSEASSQTMSARSGAAAQFGGFTLRVDERPGLVPLGPHEIAALSRLVRDESSAEPGRPVGEEAGS
ncbi:hypothetical protein SAMN05443377_11655 [Propionibacterium cyclohexanicum]|uniref:Uncharacterized protein n=1 Tax=Propionibacterium cyclohexanicum TaxID=64702 RepID=A0A1H9SWH1_9ACTN|nr:hypothetical protein [Propionibacterium cyclohexanicum]SER89197.1 hypothetical protein SAMN05443377_11655 [Propionibacterium cyclohexanicum]